MTNRQRVERIEEVIHFFSNKDLVFKNDVGVSAKIFNWGYGNRTNVELYVSYIQRQHPYSKIWAISISSTDLSVDWSWDDCNTDDWDLLLGDISFKKCIKEGLSCLTLYDIVQ